MNTVAIPAAAPSPKALVLAAMRQRGYAVLPAAGLASISATTLAQLHSFDADWDTLPPDNYLKDGGHYRKRRHSCFVVDGGKLMQVPHRAHWQPVTYNALHGGMQRWFGPIEQATNDAPAWRDLLVALAALCSELKGAQPWYVEAHQFRIDTSDGIGRPTPEGAHRDGVDFVAVIMIGRHAIKGGETRVFEIDGPNGQRFTLEEPWSLLLLDDEKVIHETTPIQPMGQPLDAHAEGHRDTLVLTFRAKAFQGED